MQNPPVTSHKGRVLLLRLLNLSVVTEFEWQAFRLTSRLETRAVRNGTP
jgi:hypothetical protein